jgi:signal transduction histidine kinase
VGFGLDALARHPGIQADLAHEVRELRHEVSRMLADIRLSIADLRVGVAPDQGLGRVLSAQLQQFGATTGSAVQVELRESTVRLPVDIEQALARLSHELLVDARTGRAGSVRVVLESEPPMATFLLEHDGSTQWDAGEQLSPALAKLGAQMNVVRPQQAGGVAVIVHVGEIPATAGPAYDLTQPQDQLTEGVGA